MNTRREFIRNAGLIGGMASFTLPASVFSQLKAEIGTSLNSVGVISIGSPVKEYKPLQSLVLHSSLPGIISIIDSDGFVYSQAKIEKEHQFTIGAGLGDQFIVLTDEAGKITDTLIIHVNAHTSIEDKGGKYQALLNTLYYSMIGEFGQVEIVRINNKFYHFFVRWLRDHVHTMKGMKYFYPELKTGVELYSDFQREDGMIWDNLYKRDENPNHWEQRFEDGDFIKIIEDFKFELKRIPVENDVEYLFLEGIYYTWKATGDDLWMKELLDKAIKAVEYSFSSPYRWSEKYQLLKRGYTIDTWDFQSSFDVERSGDPMVVKPGISEFGIMFGDNTGMAASLGYLSEMLLYTGRENEAAKYQKLASGLLERLDKLAWNGKHYTHHIPENLSIKRDFGIDTSKQVSLSNAYSVNRNISHEKCVEIIKTYQEIRQSMPQTSPGEWYTIYPPFHNGFGDHNGQWEYMNGGVTSIVAGELAHGAFEHGYENYGADILDRIGELAKSSKGHLHCTYKGKLPEEPVRNFTPISIQAFANTDTSGSGAKGVPGWTGEGDNDLQDFPHGNHTFHGIPFLLTDPANNGRKACIGISSRKEYAQDLKITVKGKASSVYLLHTRGKSGNPAGLFSINYTDGSCWKEYIDNRYIGNWWYPNELPSTKASIPQTLVGWSGKNKYSKSVGVYLSGFNNPKPEKTIESLQFTSVEHDGIWLIMGISLCDAEVYFKPGIISFGIPDNWGAAANVYALVEGLAGVKDLSASYKKALLVPRWPAAKISEVNTSIRYEASKGYISYRYRESSDKIMLTFTGSAQETIIKMMVPENKKVLKLFVNGVESVFETELIEETAYAKTALISKGVHTIEMALG